MAKAPLSPKEYAIELASPLKYHRLFTLPATSSHGPLKISYSIAGPALLPDEDFEVDVPTILFIGGMFGTRWMAVSENWLAEKEGVRVLFIDRPEFGGSEPLPPGSTPSTRIEIFLETVPALLAHLRIKHISLLASHSAGTIYALNLLHRRPDLLSPSNPRVTLFAPWVHYSISGVGFLQAAAKIPNPLVNHWNALCGWMATGANVSGVNMGTASSGLFNSVSNFLTVPSTQTKAEKERLREELEKKCEETCGFGLEMKDTLDKVVMQYVFAELTKGGNDEARLCLRSVPGCSWDACNSYPDYVSDLNHAWSDRTRDQHLRAPGAEAPVLNVKVIFGETDVMIGAKGRAYFEDCWTQEKLGGGIKVKIEEMKGADHDSIVHPFVGAIGAMFKDAKGEVERVVSE